MYLAYFSLVYCNFIYIVFQNNILHDKSDPCYYSVFELAECKDKKTKYTHSSLSTN